MPNNYFSFKEFTVYQDKCAMKVCTDACIQGAFTATHLNGNEKNILDIGTGTGLLSLMLAQNSSAKITGLEIDPNAFDQAAENFRNSKWKNQLSVQHIPLQQFSSELCFDLIICNPPFYENNLQSPEEKKNKAMHSTMLTLEELVKSISGLLSENGKASVMIPYFRMQFFNDVLQKNNLFAERTLLVKQTTAHDFFRCFFLISKYKGENVTEELAIKNKDQYTKNFIDLLKPYYLKL